MTKSLLARACGALLLLLYVSEHNYLALELGQIAPFRLVHRALHPSLFMLPDRWLLGQVVTSAVGALGIALIFPRIIASPVRDLFSQPPQFGLRSWLLSASAVVFSDSASFVIVDIIQRLLPTADGYAPFAGDVRDAYNWLTAIARMYCTWRIIFGRRRHRSDYWLGSGLAIVTLLPLTVVFSYVSLGRWTYTGSTHHKILADQTVRVALSMMAVWIGIALARTTVWQSLQGEATTSARYRLMLGGLVLIYSVVDLISNALDFWLFAWARIAYLIIGVGLCGYVFAHLLRVTLSIDDPILRSSSEVPMRALGPLPIKMSSHQFWRSVALGASASALLIMLGFVATNWIRSFAFVASGPTAIIVGGIVFTRYGYAVGAVLLLIGIAIVRVANLMS